jgi:hypothetical protein
MARETAQILFLTPSVFRAWAAARAIFLCRMHLMIRSLLQSARVNERWTKTIAAPLDLSGTGGSFGVRSSPLSLW